MARIDAGLASKARRFRSARERPRRSGCRGRSSVSVAGLALVLALTLAAGRQARANNGIPGSLGVLLPLDKPQEIGLGHQRSGSSSSDDGGASWVWTCEQVPPPRWPTSIRSDRHRWPRAPSAIAFYAGATKGCPSRTTNLRLAGRGWGAGRSEASPTSSSTPPTRARVLAAAAPPTTGATPRRRRSMPRRTGRRRSAPRRSSRRPPAPRSSAIEIARSDPNVVYLSTYMTMAARLSPVLVRSADGGRAGRRLDLHGGAGARPSSGSSRSTPADPAICSTCGLIANGSRDVAMTRDGGMTFATPLTIAGGALSAFARLASGTVLVGALRQLRGRRRRRQRRRLPVDRRRHDLVTLVLEPPAALVGLGERVVAGQVDTLHFGQELQSTAGRWPARRTKG